MSRLDPQPAERIDRSKKVKFKFDGKSVEGFEGDTVASVVSACSSGNTVLAICLPSSLPFPLQTPWRKSGRWLCSAAWWIYWWSWEVLLLRIWRPTPGWMRWVWIR